MATPEMNHLFEVDQEGFVQFSGVEAVEAKLQNWISTPRGSIFGKPEWGHTLRQFLHDPPTDTLAGVIEAELADTLEVDLPDVSLLWVRVAPSEEFDGYHLQLGWNTDEEIGTSELSVRSGE